MVLATAHVAWAEPCPPAVALTGDDALVGAIRELLGARGITHETPRCPAIRARVERRGPLLVVGIDGPDGVPIERSVTEAATAATVDLFASIVSGCRGEDSCSYPPER